MTPVHELLNRIRWDADFGAAQFSVGYYDRIRKGIIVVPFSTLSFPAENHFDFTLLDEQGALRTIPLHRIRQVFRNGELIWERPVEEQSR